MNLIELENIALSFQNTKALFDINLKIKNNQIITLVGPNGGGKTSLARIILGILAPSSGRLKRKLGLKMSYMPQKIILNPDFPISAIDFVGLSAKKCAKKNDSEIITLAKRLGLFEVLNRQFHDLSGGQQQKLSFLRAISRDYDLLVLDEPTQFMDLSAIDEFYRIIEELRGKNQCSILLISHDLHLVMQKTDLVYCINQHICCHGHAQQIEQNPEFIKIFGQIFNSKSHFPSNSENSKTHHLGIYRHRHNHQHQN